jgi:membrane-bound ClpP family serine protease
MQLCSGALSEKASQKMLGVIAAVLIVLWLLGFLAFHVSSGLVHVLLIIGIVMLALHFFRGREATA